MHSKNKPQHRILVNSTPYQKRIALLDDNHLSEVFYDHSEDIVTLGSIYKGVVNAVLPGLQAAFVDLGTDKAGFLHVDDVGDCTHKLSSEYEEDGEDGSILKTETIDQLLKVGQEIVVQVTKEPISTKGPRLTSHITLAGRFLVCMPNTQFVGVSKKSRDMGRRRELKRLVQRLKGSDVGYIVRTLGLRESEVEFKKQMQILENKWAVCQERCEQLEEPGLLYRDSNFIENVLRDYFSDRVEQVILDDKTDYQATIEYLKVLSPESTNRVSLHKGKTALFDHYGLEEELDKIFEPKVNLRRGGYVIIEQTEALVSIDVNTGGKVRCRNQAKNIVETNVDAAWEIAKQMRLRDLGGLIIIDFIDMDNEADIEQVENEFKKAIRQDTAPVHFSLISQFGLMELTRKRVRPNLMTSHSNLCPTCNGNRYIPQTNSILATIDRCLHRCYAQKKHRKLSLALNVKMCDKVAKNRGHILKHWEMKYNLEITLYEEEDSYVNQFRVFDTTSGEEITPLYLTSHGDEE